MAQHLKLLPEDKWKSTFKDDTIKAFITKLVKAGHNDLDKLEVQFKQAKWAPPKESKAFNDKPRAYISGYVTWLIGNGTLVRVGEKDKPAPKPAKPKAPAKK